MLQDVLVDEQSLYTRLGIKVDNAQYGKLTFIGKISYRGISLSISRFNGLLKHSLVKEECENK